MPTRLLPERANLKQLRQQAADLLKSHQRGELQALHRFREFHPRLHGSDDAVIARTSLRLHDAYLAIAREYGFQSWPRLKHFIENDDPAMLRRPAHERISDINFRRAVDLMDAGDVEGLSAHLAAHPNLVRQRVPMAGWNYFTAPALLEFIAENPTRNGSLPANAADVARAILDADGAYESAILDSTLDLVASSNVARDSGVQEQLIDVLCEYGAHPDKAVQSALLYGEFDAARRLQRRGAPGTLSAAAALGINDDVRRLAKTAASCEKALALALAAQHERVEAVRILLAAGADAASFTPVGGHAHATPLHQAALNANREIAKMLLEHGADVDRCDILYGGTPAGWADYAGHSDFAEWLRAQDAVGRPRK